MSNPPPADFMLSILVVTGDDCSSIESSLSSLHSLLTSTYRQFEIVCVDNGSTDGSQQTLLAAVGSLPNLRYLRLTRYHAPEIAATCALEHAVGDVAVTFDPVTDAPEALIPLVQIALTGSVGIAKSPRHRGAVRTFAAQTFYFVARRVLGVELALDEGRQRAYPRVVLTALSKIKNRRRNLRLFNAVIGFKQELVEVPDGIGHRHEHFSDAVRRSLDLLFSNSLRPLRWVSWLGCIAALANVFYLGYVAAVNLTKAHVAEGWTTLSATNSVMFLLLFMILTVLAEYVGRILEEVQERPLYFIEFERDGSVQIGERVVNVV